MGGAVSVTLRKDESTVIRMLRHTNAMPWWMKHPDFLDPDSQRVADYLAMYDESRKAYEAGNKSYYYDPDAVCAPDGYGLVVWDYVSKHILSMQGYCFFGTIHRHDVRSAFHVRGATLDDVERLQAGFMAGFFKERRILLESEVDGEVKFEWSSEPLADSWDEEASYLREETRDPVPAVGRRLFDGYNLNFEEFGWTLIHYDDYGDTQKYKDKLEELGFKFSDSDNAAWDRALDEEAELLGEDE